MNRNATAALLRSGRRAVALGLGFSMLVTGSLYADVFARIGASGSRHDAPAPREAGAAHVRDAAKAEDRSAHFSVISTISPGSLAAAYQVMRAREDGGAPAASGPAQGRAILSGLGIPSALDAYGEVLESD